MNLLYKYCIIIASVFFLFSCDKETEGISRITAYCDLNLKGNATEFVALGGAYNEPGWEASEAGVDISDQVVVSGMEKIDAQTAGLYTLIYSVNNSDGYPKEVERQVIVYDTTPSDLESGFYQVSTSSNRTSLGNGPAASGSVEFESGPTVVIYQVSPGQFYMSDFLGGYYVIGRDYGPDYAMTGIFQLNPDNTLELVKSGIIGFGDELGSLVNTAYNPATKTISYTAQYAGAYDFNIVATKID